MRNIFTIALLALLGSCQTWGPTWSEVTGTRYNVTAMGVGPVLINLVDGASPGTGPREPVKITPGQHTLVLQVIPPGSVAGLINMEQTTFDAKPCTRYYINGRFDPPTGTSWRPFIDHEEMIAGCQVTPPAK